MLLAVEEQFSHTRMRDYGCRPMFRRVIKVMCYTVPHVLGLWR